jgi:hypothetical protein
MKRNLLIEAISALLILLFVYTSTSKLYEHRSFRAVLSTSPLINEIASVVAWGVPVVLLGVALLLIIPGTRRIGLWGSFILMLLFTLYISYMLAFASKLPCSCGGVFKQLTWNQHLYFNLICMLIALCGLWLNRKNTLAKNRISHAMVISRS